MQFRTELQIKNLGLSIDHEHKIMLMGSCFTEHIATSLDRFRFQVFSNSHGIIFHPIPLANALNDLISAKNYDVKNLMENNGNWISLNHHGKFSSSEASETLNRINASIQEGHRFLKESSTLLVTFGTAIGYTTDSHDGVVANCHKLDGKFFQKRRSTVSELTSVWKQTIQTLVDFNTTIKVVFTVSPVRHLREGFEENQKSKATLLLAIEELCSMFPDTIKYFPSYELMMDDLRDYRFYESDMIHPNAQAIEYIRLKFFGAAMSLPTLRRCDEMESHIRRIEHRGINETNEQKERRITEANEAIRTILLKS
jgi:hypothetical protein